MSTTAPSQPSPTAWHSCYPSDRQKLLIEVVTEKASTGKSRVQCRLSPVSKRHASEKESFSLKSFHLYGTRARVLPLRHSPSLSGLFDCKKCKAQMVGCMVHRPSMRPQMPAAMYTGGGGAGLLPMRAARGCLSTGNEPSERV